MELKREGWKTNGIEKGRMEKDGRKKENELLGNEQNKKRLENEKNEI